MPIPGVIVAQHLDSHVLTRDYAVMGGLTVFLAIAILVSRRRRKSDPEHAYLGRSLGFILVSSYALYYYLLHSTV